MFSVAVLGLVPVFALAALLLTRILVQRSAKRVVIALVALCAVALGVFAHYWLATTVSAMWVLLVGEGPLLFWKWPFSVLPLEMLLACLFLVSALVKRAGLKVNLITACILFSWVTYPVACLVADAVKPNILFCPETVVEGRDIFAGEEQILEGDICRNISWLSSNNEHDANDAEPRVVRLRVDGEEVFAAHKDPFYLHWTAAAGRHTVEREAELINGKRIYAPKEVVEVMPRNPIRQISFKKDYFSISRGRPATLEVLAPLGPEYTYQWRKFNDSTGRWISIPSANSPRYTVPEVYYERSYSCVIRKGPTSRESGIIHVSDILKRRR